VSDAGIAREFGNIELVLKPRVYMAENMPRGGRFATTFFGLTRVRLGPVPNDAQLRGYRLIAAIQFLLQTSALSV
jgi:hypothetical protein